MTTTVCGSDVLGGRKCGSNALYDGAEDGTVYTESLARVSMLKYAWINLLVRQCTRVMQIYPCSSDTSSPSSASSRTSAQSYPSAKSSLWSSLTSAEGGLFSSAAASVDLPDDGSPRMSSCFAGIEREDETESRMEDHRSCGGASGELGLESFMVSI